jgi:hypothetical protein
VRVRSSQYNGHSTNPLTSSNHPDQPLELNTPCVCM